MFLITLLLLALIFVTTGYSINPPGPPINTTTAVPTTTPSPVPPPREKVICRNFRNYEDKFVHHGDISCRVDDNIYASMNEEYAEEDQLLVRATLLSLDLFRKSYYKKLSNVVVTKVNVLNFGEDQAFVDRVIIENGDNDASVWAHIEVPPLQEVKLFVEIYGHRRSG